MTAQNLRELISGDGLNANEVDVLLGAALGETAIETAERMSYADETVKTMRKYVIAKLNAKNITNAVGIGLALGIINPDLIVPEDL